MFKIDGKQACAVGKKQDPNMPTVWNTYIKTDSADETAEKVRQAGGNVMMEPFDVFDTGRMAVFADKEGAVFSVWQAGTSSGAEVFNTPGALSWNELTSKDASKAKPFYSAVFGWDSDDHDMGPMTYTEWKLNDKSIGGMIDMGDQLPAGVPAFWLPYFAVDDCDATVAKTEQIGGSIMRPPMDIPAGRFSILRDPEGAVFAVIKLASQT
jgi:predicted enzyme related to lactoylglutathione lyase